MSSGNIFADLGLKDAEELYTRAALGIEIIKIIKARDYSQKEAAAVLNVKQPEISALMSAKFQRFSQERLIGFLNKLNQKVTFQISRHRKGQPFSGSGYKPLRREPNSSSAAAAYATGSPAVCR